MREIKFRGKVIHHPLVLNNDKAIGEWVDGDLHLKCRIPHIHVDSQHKYPIDVNTIGQFTGLCDKNGKEIYEGDIVLQKGYNGKKISMCVEFSCGAFIVGYHKGSSTTTTPMLISRQCEVIGNIYDNALLKEGER